MTRLSALAIGLATGLIVLVVLTAQMGLPSPSSPTATPQPAPKAQPTPVAQILPTRSPAPSTTTPFPAPTPSRVRVGSLAELTTRASALAGQQIEVVLTEEDLARQAEAYLRSSGNADVSNLGVKIQDNRIALSGTARQGILGVDFTVTGHPRVDAGALNIVVDSVEPALISKFSQVAPGQVIDISQGFEAESVSFSGREMIVNGQVR